MCAKYFKRTLCTDKIGNYILIRRKFHVRLSSIRSERGKMLSYAYGLHANVVPIYNIVALFRRIS